MKQKNSEKNNEAQKCITHNERNLWNNYEQCIQLSPEPNQFFLKSSSFFLHGSSPLKSQCSSLYGCRGWMYVLWSIVAGNHQLCPLLTTVLAKLRSHTEVASPQTADCICTPAPIPHEDSPTLRAYIRTTLEKKGSRRTETVHWGHLKSRAGPQKLR